MESDPEDECIVISSDESCGGWQPRSSDENERKPIVTELHASDTDDDEDVELPSVFKEEKVNKHTFKRKLTVVTDTSEDDNMDHPTIVKHGDKHAFERESTVVMDSHVNNSNKEHPSVLQEENSEQNEHTFKKWKVFDTKSEFFKDSKRVASILLSPPQDKMNSSVPLGCDDNLSFLVDTSNLKVKADITCDETGKYKKASIAKCEIVVDDEKNVFNQKAAYGDDCRKLTLVRRYFAHKDTHGFHRTIYELHDANTQLHPIVLIRYEWRTERRPLDITPHGNAKYSNSPYIRAKKELVDELKTTGTTSAQETVNEFLKKQGGAENITEFSSVPRNRQMIYNHGKAKMSKTSDFQKLMEMSVKEDFVQGFEIYKCPKKGPLPRCVLYTQQQIQDLKKYCCDGGSVLNFDCTFECGSMYVTIGCYRHPMFQNKKNGKNLLMPGPILLHSTRDQDTYSYMGQQISSALGKKGVKFIGTDGEKALYQGLQKTSSFAQSRHLLCMLHGRKNVEQKLTDLGIRKNANRILRSIFGEQIDDVRYHGLVDSDSCEEYEQQVTHWVNLWNAMESEETGREPQFSNWYMKYKKAEVKKGMLKELREAAGLGSPPRQFTTNDSETMNAMISKWINKRMKWDELACSLQKFVLSKYHELELAVIGLGEACLADDFIHLQQDQMKWRNISQEERRKLLKDAGAHLSAKKKYLSIQVEESGVGGFTTQQLEDIWEGAEALLENEHQIVSFPDANNQWICFSGQHHFKVTGTDTGSFQCACRAFQFYDRALCSHTLAIAEKFGKLAEHLCAVNKKKRTSSVNLVNNILQTQCEGACSGKKTSHKRIGANNSTGSTIKKVVQLNSTHQPFTVARKVGLISTCYGCRQKFKESMNHPPNDLILKKLDFREWQDRATGMMRKSPTLVPTYYHLNLDCVRRRFPYTRLNEILVYPAIEENLTEHHKEKLHAFGIDW